MVQLTRSKNKVIVDLIALQCRAISWEHDKSLQEDLESMTDEVKEVIEPQLVDVLLEVVSKYREGLKNERYSDRKTPWVLAYNMYNGTHSKAEKEKTEAEQMCTTALEQLIDHERIRFIWYVVVHKSWAEQNSEDFENSGGGRLTGSRWGYRDDALKDTFWGDYYSNFMGFSEKPKVAPNVTVKLLCYHKARWWTAENVPSTRSMDDYGPKSREAAFQIAEERAKALLDEQLVDKIVEMCEALRAMTHWDRQGSASPLNLVAGLVDVVTGREETPQNQKDVKEADAKKALEDLSRMPTMDIVCNGTTGETNAQMLYQLCDACAWHEQNKVDYECASTVDQTTGHCMGYKEDSDKQRHNIELISYQLKFGDPVASRA